MSDDPVLRAIAEANPVSDADFARVPALGPLPHRHPVRRRVLPLAAAAVLAAAAAFAAFALTPSSTPGGSQLLKRAFALERTGEILHWRLKTTEPGLNLTFTEDLWLHVTDDGIVDKLHELRLDGQYAGEESVISQPRGLGDTRGAVDRTRRSADGPITTSAGVGYPDISFSAVIATALKAADGKLDVGAATPVDYDGTKAYAIRLHDNDPLTPGTTRRNPSQLSVTVWLDRETARPLAVRWGEGDELWRTVQVQAFEQLPNDPALLDFG
jgi:hypothetical protein